MPPNEQHNRRADDARFKAIEDRLDAGGRRMKTIETELTENTKATKEIRDILDAVRAGLRVLGGVGTLAAWVGKIGGAIGVLWGLFQAYKHGEPPRWLK